MAEKMIISEEEAKKMALVQRFGDFIMLLRRNEWKILYLIHEDYRYKKVRHFAKELFANGFSPLIAGDFRPKGDEVVTLAITISDISILVAFDEETVKKGKEKGILCIDLRLE